MKTKLFFLILLSLVCLGSITAQKNNKRIIITGKVVDVYYSPVESAFVMIDGQKTSSVTDSKGKFKIKTPRNAKKIGIVAFGSGVIEELINGRTEINFKFSTISIQQPYNKNVANGEEGVNTGYSHVKKKNLTNDISRIDGTNEKYASYSSIYEMIQREVSGVRISGETIIIQDSRDFFGPVPALLIVDGVYVDTLGNIPPTSVESIEVLKGTSGIIYGSRGYGGAIVIKTKLQN